MRHPSEVFIKYLLTSGRVEAKEDQWVRFSLTNMGFPDVDPVYLSTLRKDLADRTPADLQLTNRYHKTSVKFLKEEGIWSLHNKDPYVQEATNYIINLRIRSPLEQLLLGRLDHKDIAKRINSKFNTFITAQGVAAYEHCYWNVNLLKIEEWAKLFEKYGPQQSKAIAILQSGPAMALHLSGFQQQLESKTVLKDMLSNIYFDMKEWQAQPRSVDRTAAFTQLVKAAVSIDTALSQSDAAIKESLKAFEQFRMQHSQQQVPDIRQIAGPGNFTGSGAKLLDGAPEVEEEHESK